MKLLQI